MNKTSHTIVRTLLLGTSCLSVAGLVVGGASAQPGGGTVVFGNATITDHGANNTVIDQKTGKAIINWNSFSIAAGGTVKFNQPGSNSITLNRVLGGAGSEIYGNLLANGQVWIINQNGILFGGGSRINVGGLIATTADISNSDFAAGNYSFSGGSGAAVVNQGTIRTRNGGGVVLSGASVSNQGLIQADTGTVVLGGASAFTVDFVGDGLIKYAIAAPAGKADNGQTGVSNSGTISAAGGHVIMTARAAASVQDAVVNNTGMISATSAKLANGEVVLDGGDSVDVNAGGTIDASGAGRGQVGGFVSVTGHNVTVADNATINVSGDAGGGTVKIGGDLHGAPTMTAAANTHVGHAVIRADATRTGNGGTLVVWSNGLTDFSGIFSAKGGLLGGNGGFVETSGHVLNVSPDARIDTTAPRGQTGTWLLDPDSIVITAGEGSTTQLDGSGKLALGTDPGQTDFIAPTTITNALATTNVTLEAVSLIEVDSDVIYASPHTLSLMSQGNIEFFASIQNTQASGGGGINVVAGWDGVTAPGAVLTTAGAYGADDGNDGRGEILVDGVDQNVFVGSASGPTLFAGYEMAIAAEDGGNAQVGFHGAGGGDIAIYMTDALGLLGQSPTQDGAHYAMVGNGALDGSVSGQVTGNIFVSLAGDLLLQTGLGGGCDCDAPPLGSDASGGPSGRTLGIGNEGGIGGPAPTGTVVLIGNDVEDGDDENGGFGNIIANDLGYGDVTVGRIATDTPLRINDDVDYSSSHALTLLSAGDIAVEGSLINAGSGAVTLVAGWDGVYDPAHVGTAGTFGNNNGTITIGGDNAAGDASVGTASGALSLYGANLNVTATNGNAQAGYHGGGGGNIFVTMTGNITVGGGNDSEIEADAQLGNGSLNDNVTANVTGNISLTAGGQTVFFDGTNGTAWLGNVANSGFTESGNVAVLTQSGFLRADFTQADLAGGNVFYGFTDPSVSPLFIGGFHYNASHDFTFAGAGSLNVTGGVVNAGSGAVTLVTGWDGHTVGTAAQIQAANAYGLNGAVTTFGSANQFEDAEVGSAGGLTTILTGDLVLAPEAGFHAQIGTHGTGGGDIHIVALGDATLTGGAAAADYAMIGNGSLNGDVTGTVGGNIDMRVGGETTLQTDEGLTNAWIGNFSTATNNTGNLMFVSGSFDNSSSLGMMFVSDINNGNVTFALTDPNAEAGIDTDIIYNNAHTLNLLFTGSAEVLANVQNGGSGAINVVTGWDGHTFDAAHFLDAGVFGNNGGSLVFGTSDALGNVAFGSAGGTTTVAGANVVLSAMNGYAQLGYHGSGTGAIILKTTGTLGLAGASAADFAQIGHGATFGSNANSGNVTLTAGTITAGTNQAVTAANLVIASTSAVGSLALPLRIAANTLTLQAGGAAYLTSPNNGVTLASVNTGTGSFNLSAGGAVAQSGAITATGLTVSTTSGAIALTSTANAVSGMATLNGAAAVSFYDTLSISLGASSAGGDLTLASKGNVNFLGNVQSNTGAILAVAGWDGTTTNAANFGNAGVSGNNGANLTVGGTGATGNVAVGSKSGTTTVYAAQVNVVGANGNAQLGYHGTGGGAIVVRATQDVNVTAGGSNSAMLGNGSFGTDVTGAITGDIDVRAGGNLNFNGTNVQLGNLAHAGTETGNLIVVAADVNGADNQFTGFLVNAIGGGDVTLGFTGTADQGPENNIAYSSSHTLNILSAGNLVFAGALQNAGSGAINIVAGWDGHTLSGFGASGVAGNSGKGVTIGGANAAGNVAVGSAGGQTSVYGASLAVNAAHGYAQLGFNGHGSGAILVNVSGALTLTGGGSAGQFAQIGNGGLKTSGSNSGAITITAGGDVVLNGGAGVESYVQIGHGGAESNSASEGYSNVAAITVTGANVLLNAGTGAAAYVQIGNGGYKVGQNLTGTASNTGAISVTSGHAVTLTGNGADAYAQIGNGGSQINTNPSAAAHGDISGDIVVTAPNGAAGAVTLLAGLGANAYAMIGNGGYAANAGATATVANFTMGGNLSVTDLALTGGNTGPNAFAAIGNGDASKNSTGNVSGNIVIGANGQITYTNGTAPHSPATIGNFTGQGTVAGTLEGAQPPSDVTTDPVIIGVVSVNTADNNNNNGNNNVTTINTVVVPAPVEPNGGATQVPSATATPGALASLDHGGDSSTPNTSDSATTYIADSLNGAKQAGSTTLLSGMLRQQTPTSASNTVHGVPPADQDFSSWGNEALWQ